MRNPNRTTKAERRKAKAALAENRRRAAAGGAWAKLWARLANDGIAKRARVFRPLPTTWWFRGSLVPDFTAGRDRARLTMTADPDGAYIVKFGGNSTPAPPQPKPSWSMEAKFPMENVNMDALKHLFGSEGQANG